MCIPDYLFVMQVALIQEYILLNENHVLLKGTENV